MKQHTSQHHSDHSIPSFLFFRLESGLSIFEERWEGDRAGKPPERRRSGAGV